MSELLSIRPGEAILASAISRYMEYATQCLNEAFPILEKLKRKHGLSEIKKELNLYFWDPHSFRAIREYGFEAYQEKVWWSDVHDIYEQNNDSLNDFFQDVRTRKENYFSHRPTASALIPLFHAMQKLSLSHQFVYPPSKMKTPNAVSMVARDIRRRQALFQRVKSLAEGVVQVFALMSIDGKKAE